MATLESLELTIESNAQSAVQGIGSLIRSLSALSNAIGKPVNGLMKLNAELAKLKTYGAIKMPTIGSKVANGASATNTAKKKIDTAVKNGLIGGYYDRENNNGRGTYNPPVVDPAKEAIYQQKFAEAVQRNKEQLAYRRYMNNFYREKERLRGLGLWKEDNQGQTTPTSEVKQATQAVNEYKEAVSNATQPVKDMAKASDLENAKLEKVKAQTEKLQAQTAKLNEQTEKIRESAENGYGKAVKPIERVTSAASRFLSRVGRIASTMMIRKALNAVLKGAKEGLDNFYEYSKKIGSSYSASLDKMASGWGQMKNQMGAALGTALAAVLPILNAIASAALVAVNAITALFALLGGKTTYSQATEGMESFGKAASGAGGAVKELLANFDELNVITSQGGGGGGGGGADFGSLFKEVEIPRWMQEWRPLIEALLGGTLGALILPKIFDWLGKIFGLFGGTNALNALDILKRMFKLKDIDLDTPADGVGKFLKKFTDSDVMDGVGKVADLFDTLKNLDWKTLLIKNLPEIIKLAIELLTKLVQGMDVTSKVNVDREDFDKFTKDLEKLQNDVPKINVSANIGFDPVSYAAFVVKMVSLSAWASQSETKTIALQLVDNNFVLRDTINWINSEDTKVVWLDIRQKDNNSNNNNTSAQDDQPWYEWSFNKTLNKIFGTNLPEEGWLQYAVKQAFGDDAIIDISDLFTVKDDGNAFAKEVQQALVQSGKTALSANEMKKLKTKFPTIKAIDVFNITNFGVLTTKEQNDFLSSLMSAFGADGINAIRQKIPNISAPNIMKIVDWNTFTTEQRFEFLNAIKGAFGSKEAIAAARKAGIDIGDLVQQGMQSKDSTIRQQAEEWDKIINDEMSPAHTISVQMSSSAVSSAASYVKNTIEALKPSVSATAKYASGYPKNLKTEAEAQKPTITAYVQLASGATGSVKGAVEAINPTITASLKAGDLTAFKNAIKSAFTGAINSVSAYINGAPIKINAKAEGGLVKSGDLFLANENGNSEMIGKFGNNAAVANQEQMVEAMARGVQYANEEQTSLLRRQNELLMGILQKDNTLRLGASSALGRIARQSLDMYETATGV